MRHTGYQGRTGVFELLVTDDAIRAQIHNKASEAEIRDAALKAGMVLMRDDGERLVREGITSREELVRVTRDGVQLRAQALVPLKVDPVVAGETDWVRRFEGGLLRAARVQWREAGDLDPADRRAGGLGPAAGARADRAGRRSRGRKQRNLVAALRAEVNGGTSFAKALAQHPREFSEIYCAVIGAGEQSGNLGWCWSAWPTTWRKARRLRPN
jgi:hypothetical protein